MGRLAGVLVGILWATGCAGPGGAGGAGGGGEGAPPGPPGPPLAAPAPELDAAPVAPAPDAAPAAAPPAAAGKSCVADAQHCCMPDGTLVRPGGCQPSYPDHVQPATERAPDGTCRAIRCYLKCLPADARIATPRGDVAVAALRPGDEVWTMDREGQRVAAPVVRVRSLAAERHTIAVVRLDDGRVLRASAAHPTSDGRRVGDLAAGDAVDGARVVSVAAEAYGGGRTWDLLPGGTTGLYWADGVLIGSTLAP